MITEHCAVGVIIAGARTHATLLSEDDIWMTWHGSQIHIPFENILVY